MKKLSLLAALLATTAAMPAMAHAMTGAKFVEKASVAGNFEVETSKLALEKSQNADVKKFAQEMIDDHTKAGNELKSTLAAAKVPATDAKDGLDTEHQKKLDKLKTSKDFDKDYEMVQADGHRKTIDLFTDYAEHGKNQPLVDFAKKTLPTLKMHADHLKALDKKS